jgi:hypothetical protein
MKSLGSVLKAAVVAGLVAGAAAAGFHSLLTEPVIDRAIEMEERLGLAQGEAVKKPPLVSRSAQRWGLVLGLLLYGAVWGLLFGLVFRLVESWLPSWNPVGRGLFLALLAGWSVAIFPFLKYPASPPGAGDPETVWRRQALYFGFIALTVVGTALAGWLRVRTGRFAVCVLYGVFLAAVYLAMPANPDPVRMPAHLVWTFRGLSLAGLILFWGVLGWAFGLLSRIPNSALRGISR